MRRLLDYCGLPFEDSCLRFYENERAVRTASSEQVRQPIFRDGVDQWRHYEPWLEPAEGGARAGARRPIRASRISQTDIAHGSLQTDAAVQPRGECTT